MCLFNLRFWRNGKELFSPLRETGTRPAQSKTPHKSGPVRTAAPGKTKTNRMVVFLELFVVFFVFFLYVFGDLSSSLARGKVKIFLSGEIFCIPISLLITIIIIIHH